MSRHCRLNSTYFAMSPPGEEDLDDPRLWSRQPWQNLKDEKKQNFPIVFLKKALEKPLKKG